MFDVDTLIYDAIAWRTTIRQQMSNLLAINVGMCVDLKRIMAHISCHFQHDFGDVLWINETFSRTWHVLNKWQTFAQRPLFTVILHRKFITKKKPFTVYIAFKCPKFSFSAMKMKCAHINKLRDFVEIFRIFSSKLKTKASLQIYAKGFGAVFTCCSMGIATDYTGKRLM